MGSAKKKALKAALRQARHAFDRLDQEDGPQSIGRHCMCRQRVLSQLESYVRGGTPGVEHMRRPLTPPSGLQGVNEVALERYRVYLKRCLPNAELRARQDPRLDHMVLELHSSIWGEKQMEKEVKAEVVVKHPADWWQAFKKRWFPGWALKRWPVRMEVVRKVQRASCEAWVLYPSLHYRHPEHEFRVAVEGREGQVEEENWPAWDRG